MTLHEQLDTAQKISGEYDKPFSLTDGTVVVFPDFNLCLEGVNSVTKEEEREREESQKLGVEGGPSMFTNSYQFKVFSKDGTEVSSHKVMFLPFAWVSFEVGDSIYTITPDGKDFVVWNGDLTYQRNKKFNTAKKYNNL